MIAVRIALEGAVVADWLKHHVGSRNPRTLPLGGLISSDPLGTEAEWRLLNDGTSPSDASTGTYARWALERFPQQVPDGDQLLADERVSMRLEVER